MDKICYCPQCGRIQTYFLNDKPHCLKCDPHCVPFTKKYKNAEMIKTEHRVSDWPRKKKEPILVGKITPTIYNYFWDTYVDIPENDKLDRVLFEKTKKEILDFFAQGGWDGTIKDLREKPNSKDASVIGRGVAGAIIAGPAGAVIGAASALDKNMKNANKKK